MNLKNRMVRLQKLISESMDTVFESTVNESKYSFIGDAEKILRKKAGSESVEKTEDRYGFECIVVYGDVVSIVVCPGHDVSSFSAYQKDGKKRYAKGKELTFSHNQWFDALFGNNGYSPLTVIENYLAHIDWKRVMRVGNVDSALELIQKDIEDFIERETGISLDDAVKEKGERKSVYLQVSSLAPKRLWKAISKQHKSSGPINIKLKDGTIFSSPTEFGAHEPVEHGVGQTDHYSYSVRSLAQSLKVYNYIASKDKSYWRGMTIADAVDDIQKNARVVIDSLYMPDPMYV